jgi:hypothetical protein
MATQKCLQCRPESSHVIDDGNLENGNMDKDHSSNNKHRKVHNKIGFGYCKSFIQRNKHQELIRTNHHAITTSLISEARQESEI